MITPERRRIASSDSEGLSAHASPTRRGVLASGAVLGAAWAAGGIVSRPAIGAEPGTRERAMPTAPPDAEPFLICMNTSTLRGHKLPITETIDITAAAGYGGIEVWMDELDRHVDGGGSLDDLKRRLADRNLAAVGAIAFFPWMVDDDAERRKGFEEARRRMDQLARIGCTHVAAPPVGDVEKVDLLAAAERYRELLELSESFNVTPSVEVWGFAKNCFRLGQTALVAIEADHPKACVLPDVYHLYKGGSDLNGVRFVHGRLLSGFHLNDYPADPPRETIADKDRIYPGDGIAPLGQLMRDLRDIDYEGPVSIELFNPHYYAQDPALVARTAIEKTRAVIRDALKA